MFNTSKVIVVSLSLGLAATGCAAPGEYYGDRGYDQGHYQNSYYGNDQVVYARVVDADPVFDYVRVPDDRQVCYQEEHYVQERRAPTGAIVGGIIGGVLGNQVGGGNGRRAATVAGAALGASVGHNRSGYRNRSYPVTQERCEVQRNWREERRLIGYDVDYEYGGEIYTTRTRNHPGRDIRVQVNVTPAG